MNVPLVHYREGVKYWLAEDYAIQTPFRPDSAIETKWIDLTADGLLVIREGFAWDGPSGPASDTPDGMPGALVHDALYALMRSGLIPITYRAAVDAFFHSILLVSGMQPERAALWHAAVQEFAAAAADPNEPDPYPILEAPRPYQRTGEDLLRD